MWTTRPQREAGFAQVKITNGAHTTTERGRANPSGHRNDHGCGGPASIRFRCLATGSPSIDQSDSTHQVAPASTHSLTCASPAVPGSLTPSATTSYPSHGNPAASRSGRTAATTSARSGGAKGVSTPKPTLVDNSPSHSAARPSDFFDGSAPITHTGTRGCWTGGGGGAKSVGPT